MIPAPFNVGPCADACAGRFEISVADRRSFAGPVLDGDLSAESSELLHRLRTRGAAGFPRLFLEHRDLHAGRAQRDGIIRTMKPTMRHTIAPHFSSFVEISHNRGRASPLPASVDLPEAAPRHGPFVFPSWSLCRVVHNNARGTPQALNLRHQALKAPFTLPRLGCG